MLGHRELSYRQRWGFPAAIVSALLRRLRDWLGFRVYGTYTRQLSLSPNLVVAPPGCSYRRFVDGEADALIACAQCPGLDLPPLFVCHALEKGDVCEAILIDGRIVSYSWSAFTPTHDDDGVYVFIDEKYRYDYKWLTLPEYRGHHLSRLFKPLGDRYCAEVRGCTHSVVIASIDNWSSIKSIIAQGYCRIGFVGYLKRGTFFWSLSTPRVRRHGFRFFLPFGKD